MGGRTRCEILSESFCSPISHFGPMTRARVGAFLPIIVVTFSLPFGPPCPPCGVKCEVKSGAPWRPRCSCIRTTLRRTRSSSTRQMRFARPNTRSSHSCPRTCLSSSGTISVLGVAVEGVKTSTRFVLAFLDFFLFLTLFFLSCIIVTVVLPSSAVVLVLFNDHARSGRGPP